MWDTFAERRLLEKYVSKRKQSHFRIFLDSPADEPPILKTKDLKKIEKRSVSFF
ncbi:hypothetical protein LEP1GSC194_1335 [Leptospira alstonii serovar Sichuan str. 79601]|uniref:Uncharacterized protein n=1 Tax=Leptospira alstonii serovar Sichuan str. 79601 TaxID=1218565 RepID=M6CXC4_9LEPT|nr:hypothetical protein LEP1GSC194_1335 [Leptospira alstonii serovar Sichuan str. 79601]